MAKSYSYRLTDDVRLRVAVWIKTKWLNLKEGLIDLAMNLHVVKIPSEVKPVRKDANVILCFSKAAGYVDSNFVELLAAKEAFLPFISSQWASSHTLAVESDASNVVMWVNLSG
ncbi:hypothetical protein PTKIN_Ptkin10aG0041300 [Pterospermum kingtungense]